MSSLPTTILGYCFNNTDLLRQALTHPSYLNEHREVGHDHYQRLEFLGDAVLSLCLADLLSERFPELPEGDLSRLRASLVDQPRLAELAEQAGIGEQILLGKGEERDGGRHKPSILSDILEALIGAIYRDAGFMAVRALVEQIYEPLLAQSQESTTPNDPKSELQEWLAARRQPVPVYELVEEAGPAHDRRFTVAVVLDGATIGTGEGRSKKAAQQAAAQEALHALRAGSNC